MAKKTDTWMPFYVTDYLGDTMHLSTTQHGAYLLLLLACWKAGGDLPDDDTQLASITRMSAGDWKKSAPVLRRFFEAVDGLLSHGRVKKELDKAKELSEKRSGIGKLGGRPPKAKQTETNRFPDAEAKTNQTETPSPSPKQPSLRSGRKSASELACPPDVDPQVWADWQTLRRKKSAPVTATVLDGAIEQAGLAGMTLEAFLRVWCRRGSQGLEAEWLKPDERGQQAETTYQRSMRERMQEAAPEAARKDPSHAAHAADFFNAIEVPARTVERIR